MRFKSYALAALSLCAASLALTPSDVRATCMAPRLALRGGTPDGTLIASAGAALVQIGNGYSATVPQFDEHARTIDIRGGAAPIAMRLEWIVPGLARLVPSAPVPAGSYQIDQAIEHAALTYGAGTLPPAPPAPRVSSIVRTETMARWTTLVNVDASLGAPVPPGVAFTVARWGTGTDTFAAATAGSSRAPLFVSPGRCGSTMSGHEPPPAGTMVQVAFVDAQGQLGAWSSPIRVR